MSDDNTPLLTARQLARFWRRVDKAGSCWTWRGGVQQGAGMVTLSERRRVRAHRVSYELAFGPIPPATSVQQVCGNRLCVKPQHLRIVEGRPPLPTGDGTTIELTRGAFVMVDEEDYDRLSQWSWTLLPRPNDSGYAVRYSQRSGRRVPIYMHRQIMGAPDGVPVDHKNGNGLDNRKWNLRLATQSLNGANRARPAGCTTPYRGVRPSRCGWIATIKANRRTYHLGSYDSAEDAGRAYDAAAKQYFGQFARLNFPLEAHR